MEPLTTTLLILGGIASLLIILYIFYWNRFVVLANRIANSWAQIDVQLKKRYDLVPNLISTVKGYAKHEKKIFENVTKARERMMSAKAPGEKYRAGQDLTSALKTILAIAENYPKLRANENFLMLQEELSGIENKIAYARQFYNDSVLEYNNIVMMFPGNIFANIMNKKSKEYLDVPSEERKNIKVNFDEKE